MTSGTGLGFTPLEGNFSAFLFGGDEFANSSITISQTGLVPSGSLSLQMLVGTYDGFHNGPFVVALNGQMINMVALQSFQKYILFAGDVSSYAGKVGTLSITAVPVAFAPNMVSVDGIVFSAQAVPEPSAFALAGIGFSLFGFRRWRKARR